MFMSINKTIVRFLVLALFLSLSNVTFSRENIIQDDDVLMDYVDLGLSVKWATRNLGAKQPEDYGNYYAWGETSAKNNYRLETYELVDQSRTTRDMIYINKYYTDNLTELELKDDAAHRKLGGNWRIPTADDFIDLMAYCEWEWTVLNGVYGYLVTSKVEGYTGNSIFLPAAGRIDRTELLNDGYEGRYSTSTLSTPMNAKGLAFNSSKYDLELFRREYGWSIRPVYESKTYGGGSSVELLNKGLSNYLGRNGYEQDYKKAYDLLLEAAKQNNADAQSLLGYMFENGIGVTKDYSKAMEWYWKAALQNQSGAQYNLGRMYANGDGVERDKDQAISWFKKAQSNGNNDAANALVKLEKTDFDIYRQIALIIGNADYPKGRLSTPINDAQDLAAKLKSIGYEVIVKTNLDLKGINQIMDEFCQKAAGYDVALFYYSGYAAQNDGVNYLIPAKSSLEPATVMYDCANVSRFMAKLDASEIKAKIVILDACRDNSPLIKGKGTIKQGLVKTSQLGYVNIISAQADKTVTDKKGERNSIFTSELLNEIDKPNVSIYQMFKAVQTNVSNKTEKEQVPSINDDLIGTFYFNARF